MQSLHNKCSTCIYNQHMLHEPNRVFKVWGYMSSGVYVLGDMRPGEYASQGIYVQG